jgi:hypothetical protein
VMKTQHGISKLKQCEFTAHAKQGITEPPGRRG